ncbi:thioredoxin family protein [uncultured Paraglaciecola sp.]|mgnify:FL=1|uniref:thioredoxin family protein n=1 Tax=uncultured Paraglaciecola sp. TaxID=1765024 RepID=UPI0025CCE9E5|nr:thioredoxin family protein [uncultured Paraglaciecola sp.]
MSQQKPLSLSKILSVVVLIILLSVLGYYGNKTVQSYLGQQAIDKTGLEIRSLEQALALAKGSNKLVLADMSAIWCPSCRKLDQQVFSDQQVKTRINQHFVYARIEYDSAAGQTFMQHYQVTGFPTLLVLNADGEKLVQLPVSYQPLPFMATLAKVVNASL